MARKPTIGPSVAVGTRAQAGTPVGTSPVSSGAISTPLPPTQVIVSESFYYEHVQTSPAGEWTINHNLGKKPNISVFVNGNETLVPVEHLDNNTAHIIWAVPTAGSAYCS